MKVLFKEFITVWTRGLVRWLSRKFDSISIDLTPVEDKLDDVKSDVADVKTAVENIDFSTLAKQGTNADATLTAVLEALTGGDDPSPDIPEGVAERLAMILEFFGIKPIDGYHAMTEAEVMEIADEVWEAMYGFVAVPNTVHTVDASESERVFTTYMNPTKTYADYGWPALWDAQGVTIPLTDHPTANRVIYTFNPSND